MHSVKAVGRFRQLCWTRVGRRALGGSSQHTGNNGEQNGEDSGRSRFVNSKTLSVVTAAVAGIVGYYELRKRSTSIDCPRLMPVLNAATGTGENKTGYRDRYNFFADVVERSSPAVVYIDICDPKTLDFFHGGRSSVANGSGFIVQEDGLILTNAHVVINRPNFSVIVKLHDGRKFNAVVEYVDTVSDLAAIRIPCKNLPTMKLGNSVDIRAGEWVLALGSPLALHNTVTVGVVSSPHRGLQELGIKGKDISYIQTDAAITFGNSGGPLVNLDGEVIGINSMKITAGISFAIPIDHAKEFLKVVQNRQQGKHEANKRYIGITMLTLTNSMLKMMRDRGRPVPDTLQHGILVCRVINNSPAERAGLQPGDIITHINGKPMLNSQDVYDELSSQAPLLKILILREEVSLIATVVPDAAIM